MNNKVIIAVWYKGQKFDDGKPKIFEADFISFGTLSSGTMYLTLFNDKGNEDLLLKKDEVDHFSVVGKYDNHGIECEHFSHSLA